MKYLVCFMHVHTQKDTLCDITERAGIVPAYKDYAFRMQVYWIDCLMSV